jgi:hypothetical protein
VKDIGENSKRHKEALDSHADTPPRPSSKSHADTWRLSESKKVELWYDRRCTKQSSYPWFSLVLGKCISENPEYRTSEGSSHYGPRCLNLGIHTEQSCVIVCSRSQISMTFPLHNALVITRDTLAQFRAAARHSIPALEPFARSCPGHTNIIKICGNTYAVNNI